MARCTPLRRKSMRILRLLEVQETRRASGVAWNAGDRRESIQLVKRSDALRDVCSCPCEVLTTAHGRGVWAPPFGGYRGRTSGGVSPGRFVAPASIPIRPNRKLDPSGSQ